MNLNFQGLRAGFRESYINSLKRAHLDFPNDYDSPFLNPEEMVDFVIDLIDRQSFKGGGDWFSCSPTLKAAAKRCYITVSEDLCRFLKATREENT